MRDVTPLPEPLTPPWWLHDHPDRPLDERAQICACVTCDCELRARRMAEPAS